MKRLDQKGRSQRQSNTIALTFNTPIDLIRPIKREM